MENGKIYDKTTEMTEEEREVLSETLGAPDLKAYLKSVAYIQLFDYDTLFCEYGSDFELGLETYRIKNSDNFIVIVR